MSRFRISGIGLDLTTVNYKITNSIDRFDYFYTSLQVCNEFYVSNLVRENEEAKLIVEIPYVTEPSLFLLRDHLKAYGRERADIILISDMSKSDMKKVGELKLYSSEFGLNNPGKADEIEVLRKILGDEDVNYISLDVSPLYYNHDVISRSRGLGINIIGRNSFAGYLNHPVAINSFSTPYLLSFSAMHCEITILSGRDIYLSSRNKDYLELLKGEKTEETIFDLSSNVNRLSSGLDRFVYTSLNLYDVLKLSYKESSMIFRPEDISMKLAGDVEDQYIVESLKNNEISNILKVLDYPADDMMDLALAYYRVKDYLKLKYPESEGWEVSFFSMADRIIGVKVVGKKYEGWIVRKRVDNGISMFIYKSENDSVPFVLTDQNYQ